VDLQIEATQGKSLLVILPSIKAIVRFMFAVMEDFQDLV
jgi:hypothetical protein